MADKKVWQPKGDKWQKAGQTPTWDYVAEGENSTFFGKFLSKQENVGVNNSNLYEFVRFEDEEMTKRLGNVAIWGSTILDNRFKNLEKGEKVVVVYLGQALSEKRKKPYHNFEVYHSMEEPTEDEVEIPEIDFDNLNLTDIDLDSAEQSMN